ncbi:unnamed protein product [Cuscuta europaea]|uniref:Uncharacterized protein n=1 Tax=Cuscuta europaea TaxID=41803 RepID=A0A9P1E8T6_CUSEU|nr:unnamed protein product [Cuscuta europaea]
MRYPNYFSTLCAPYKSLSIFTIFLPSFQKYLNLTLSPLLTLTFTPKFGAPSTQLQCTTPLICFLPSSSLMDLMGDDIFDFSDELLLDGLTWRDHGDKVDDEGDGGDRGNTPFGEEEDEGLNVEVLKDLRWSFFLICWYFFVQTPHGKGLSICHFGFRLPLSSLMKSGCCGWFTVVQEELISVQGSRLFCDCPDRRTIAGEAKVVVSYDLVCSFQQQGIQWKILSINTKEWLLEGMARN